MCVRVRGDVYCMCSQGGGGVRGAVRRSEHAACENMCDSTPSLRYFSRKVLSMPCVLIPSRVGMMLARERLDAHTPCVIGCPQLVSHFACSTSFRHTCQGTPGLLVSTMFTRHPHIAVRRTPASEDTRHREASVLMLVRDIRCISPVSHRGYGSAAWCVRCDMAELVHIAV